VVVFLEKLVLPLEVLPFRLKNCDYRVLIGPSSIFYFYPMCLFFVLVEKLVEQVLLQSVGATLPSPLRMGHYRHVRLGLI
jgi:hypothetical protein